MQVSSINNNLGAVRNQSKSTFGESLTEVYPELKEHQKDELLPDTFSEKMRINKEQLKQLPGYVSRGLQGDPDANFFEFLKITKIPYFIGGPVLALMFLAGKNGNNITARNATNAVTKRIALGVAMYYIAATAAKAVIDIPLKSFRNIDMNQKYKHMVDLRADTPLKLPDNQKVEYHNWLESKDFTNLGLAYNYHKPEAEKINSQFDEIAKSFGVDNKTKLNDSDTVVGEKIKETIAMANGWKYIITAPFVMTGLGLSSQKSFQKIGGDMNGHGIWSAIKGLGNKNKKPKIRFLELKASLSENLKKPIVDSFKELWGAKGIKEGVSRTSKILGRTAILSSLILPAVAISTILAKTSLKNHKFQEHSSDNNGGVQK